MWALHIPENVRSGVDIMQVLMNGHCGESPMRLVFRVFFGAFKLWCWRRLLRFTWISGRSNQSVLKEINPEYSLEGLILSPVLWSPDKNSWLVGKGPDAGQIEGRRRRRRTAHGWMASLTQGTWVSASSGDSEGQGRLACCGPWGRTESAVT